MKVVACIQARMDSTRLPGKVMRKILGKTLIQIEFERLKGCREIDKVVLVTSWEKQNDKLALHSKKIGLDVFRGSEVDLVQRLGGAALKFKADAIVRITADNPFVDARIVDAMVKEYRETKGGIDMLTNSFPPTFPKGLNIEIVSSKILFELDSRITDPLYREIFTVFLMNENKRFKIVNFKNAKDLSSLRWTVDYAEDFVFAKEVFGKLRKMGTVFYMDDVISLLAREPQISKINKKWAKKQ